MAYKIGDKAQGGIVFYVEGSGKHGLVAAETDQSASADWEAAINICSELELNGHGDWYLPPKYELNLMYMNLHLKGLGGFAADWYWSSTEVDDVSAWLQNFGNGNQNNSYKGLNVHVRAVRAF